VSRGQFGADLARREVAVFLEDPGAVVEVAELVEGESEFLDRPEGFDPKKLLLQRPPEPLDDAVALGCSALPESRQF